MSRSISIYFKILFVGLKNSDTIITKFNELSIILKYFFPSYSHKFRPLQIFPNISNISENIRNIYHFWNNFQALFPFPNSSIMASKKSALNCFVPFSSNIAFSKNLLSPNIFPKTYFHRSKTSNFPQQNFNKNSKPCPIIS